MRSIQIWFEQHALARALFFGVMGVLTLLYPDILVQSMVYWIAGYLMLNGYFALSDSKDSHPSDYNLWISIPLFVVGVAILTFYRYTVAILPVFLGAFAIIHSVFYFALAMWPKSERHVFRAGLALLIGVGGCIVVGATFAGLATLAKVYGLLQILACVYEVIVFLSSRARPYVLS